jgi:tetratricopeptide (TPR) repeat protein
MTARPAGPSRRRRLAALAAAVALALTTGAAGYAAGARSSAVAGDPSPQPEATDNAQTSAAALVARVLANPADPELLFALGDLYYQMGEYQFAAAAMEKLLQLDPVHVPARLSLAAGLFNLGRLGEAEAQWKAVLEIDPQNVEAHYDLGFLYLNQVPPDLTAAKEAWGAVLRIAPDSDVGRSIRDQVELLEAAGPGSPAPRAEAPGSSAPPAP